MAAWVQAEQKAGTLIGVDTDGMVRADLQIRFINAAAPVQSDYIFG